MTLIAGHWRRNDRLQRASENSPPMGWGEKDNDAVVLLQQALIQAGFSIPAGATGNYRTQTIAAVQQLQSQRRALGLPVSRTEGVAGREELSDLDARLQFPVEATPSAQTQPQTLTFEFVIEGRRYRTEGDDLDGQLRHVITVLHNRLSAAIQSRQGYLSRQNSFFRGISDALGGTSIPPESTLLSGQFACGRASRALSEHDYPAVIQNIGEALVYYHVAKSQWRSYIEGTYSGADRASTGLDWTSTILLSVAAAYFTGGASVGAEAVLLALARVGLRGAAVSGGITAVRELAVLSHEWFIDLDHEANWRQMAATIAASGVAGFVSAVTGGWLRPHVARLFPGIAEDGFVAVNELLARSGFPAMTRQAWQGTLRRVATRVVTSIGQSVLAEAARTAVAEYGTRGSLDEFLKHFIENWPREAVARAIAQAVMGVPPQP